uniref:sarcosine oxidasee (formaldehyde-forming) n=1 Tax=Caenorhabditis tropicalis TaxID=1561998 RepID=A0A1I7TJ40_9PELO
MTKQYDVIVVGAGIFGSCTAYHCQRLGLRTLLLEQFNLGHSNGSSHGKSRIIRYAHTDPEYVPLVGDSYSQIEELEQKRGEKLWNKLGLLWAATGNQVQSISGHLSKHNIEHEVVPGNKIADRYPQFKFDDKWTGLIDPMGGVIYANKWLSAYQDEFRNLGGTIQENEPVISHDENDNGTVSVNTKSGHYTTNKIIFTVGCWITKFFPNVNFEIKPISLAVCYWNAKKEENSQLLSEKNFPVLIAKDLEKKEYYFALPDTDYPGAIKLVLDDGDALSGDMGHPEKNNQDFIDKPGNFITEHIPVVDGSKPYKVDQCKYTNSPDHHYLIGPVSSKNPNILVGGCGSGSGFKTAPGIGKALAEMAAGKQTTVDVSFFSPSRFEKSV